MWNNHTACIEEIIAWVLRAPHIIGVQVVELAEEIWISHVFSPMCSVTPLYYWFFNGDRSPCNPWHLVVGKFNSFYNHAVMVRFNLVGILPRCLSKLILLISILVISVYNNIVRVTPSFRKRGYATKLKKDHLLFSRHSFP